MAEDFSSLVERLHNAQLRLEELNAIERNQEEIRRFRETLTEVKDTLNSIASDAKGASEQTGEIKEKLEKATAALGEANKELKAFLQGLTEATGKVGQGVGKFGKSTQEVAGVLEQMDSAMSEIEALINLSEAEPHQIIAGFNNYFKTLVDRLGPLVDKFPGLGAFIIIWMEAIEQIRVSVMAIEAEVARRNRIMREVYGEDLYKTIQTSGQQRAQEITRLEEEIAALSQQVAEHPDNPGTGLSFGTGAAEQDPRTTDVKAAEGMAARGGMSPQDFAQATTALSWTRWHLTQAWQRLQDLQRQLLLTNDELVQARSQLAVKQATLASARSNRAHHQAEVKKAEDEIKRLEDRAQELQERIAGAETNLQQRYDEYTQARAPVDAHVAQVRGTLASYSPAVDDDFLERNYPWYTPSFWDVPQQDQIESRLRSIPAAPAAPPLTGTRPQDNPPPKDRPSEEDFDRYVEDMEQRRKEEQERADKLPDEIVPGGEAAFDDGLGDEHPEVAEGGRRKLVMIGGGGLLAALIAIPMVLVVATGGGGDKNDAAAIRESSAGQSQAGQVSGVGSQATATIVVTPTQTQPPQATATATPESASGQTQQTTGNQQASAPPVSAPSGGGTTQYSSNGKSTGTFDNVVTRITGTCALGSPSGGPLKVGDHVGGTGVFEIKQGAGGVWTISSEDGLTGTYNPETGAFSVTTADGRRSSTGIILPGSRTMTGKSVFKPDGACTVDFDFTANFSQPLVNAEQPAAQASAAGPSQPSAGPAPTQDPTALIKAALEGEFTQAIKTGNGQYQLSHTSQAAIAFYGLQVCQAWFASIAADPTASYKVLGMTGPATWVWVYKGKAIGTIPNTYTVNIQYIRNGVSGTAQIHAAWENGQLVVFLPCEGA